MSMIAYLQQISPALVEAIQGNPSLLETLIDSATETPETEELSATATVALDIDKDWHGLHYLLTGQAWESPGILGQVILGGQEVGDDLGYGAARLLTSEQVQVVAQALSHLSTDEFAAKFNPSQLNEADIYPGNWEEADRPGLAESYENVASYYQDAAAQGQGMLLYLL
ncbi:YfbM family protein [Thermosynechococcaceae cyanobacterium BACA0444]|uniref:YfbM family protein n=1 Tax=Pseudocalidococcus azoricus BACA0444 TaxID=2918990 RepID=A0AAE4FPL0_9CYAN|nr:YfbM family protein [Pseudocalidococcus azoricus]MDS3859404.1 YfbM family protein [Pseudocalidococcus azoricus BACA0444]